MAFIDDLKERFAAVEARLEAMRARAEVERHEMLQRQEAEQVELIQALDAMERLLGFEAKNSKLSFPENASTLSRGGRQPLPEYLIRQVRMLGRATKDDLRASAVRQGFFEDGDSGGRSVHAALLNLVRGHRLQEVDGSPNIYQLPKPMLDMTTLLDERFKNEEGPLS